jgi:uncharacterized membrane protein
MNIRPLAIFLVPILCLFPIIMFGQHPAKEITQSPIHEETVVFMILEWIEYIVDLFGIGILFIGFLKGLFHFVKMEFDSLTGGETFDDILALRSILGGYIILSLDFLIISDIIHSVIKPEFNELINLGIIVVLRTSIGFFLGREIMELRHNEENQKEFEAK